MNSFHNRLGSWLVALAGLGLAVGPRAALLPAAGVDEYQVKAAFIYNFTQFIDWPPGAFATATTPMIIGILGNDPFGQTMDDLVSGETVRGHPLIVKRLHDPGEVRSCHILFLSRSEEDHLPLLLRQLKDSPVLTVTDFNDSSPPGVIINMILVDKTVKMEINKAAAAEAGLQISSKLLKLASKVKS